MVIWDDVGACKGRERKGKAAKGLRVVMEKVGGVGVVVGEVEGVVVGGRRGQSSLP